MTILRDSHAEVHNMHLGAWLESPGFGGSGMKV